MNTQDNDSQIRDYDRQIANLDQKVKDLEGNRINFERKRDEAIGELVKIQEKMILHQRSKADFEQRKLIRMNDLVKEESNK
jgi:hypothetical protein